MYYFYIIIQIDDVRHGTHTLRKRAELPLQNFKKKYARDPSFLKRSVRYDVLHSHDEIHRSWTAQWGTAFFTRAGDTSFFVRTARCVVLEPPGEIRCSSSGRRDPSFLNRPVRYDVPQPGAEIRPSAAQPSICKCLKVILTSKFRNFYVFFFH